MKEASKKRKSILHINYIYVYIRVHYYTRTVFHNQRENIGQNSVPYDNYYH